MILLPEPAWIRWGTDGWGDAAQVSTVNTGLGLHAAELDTRALQARQRVDFTLRWQTSNEWIGSDYAVEVESG